MRSGTVAVIALLCGIVGCTMTKSASQPQAASQPEPEPLSTPVVVKTVPPSTPVPEGGAAIPTRPVKNPKSDVEKKAGKAVGPIVTFAGAARADGQGMPPSSKNAQGVPVYNSVVGSGFMIVVEGKPGISNLEVARSIYRYDPNDPMQRPDIQIEVNRPLGDGSAEVCDARRPKIGGIPAINPPSWADTQQISNTLNDMGCRFETFIESNASCTLEKSGDFSFLNAKESKVQFCMVVAKSWNFPEGETLVSVRLRDVEGNPGPVTTFIVDRRPPPTFVPRVLPTRTPTAPRRRP